ncbi:putative membrane protein YedE/YeeE [Amycolatopsis lexingtonensis]|uniref:Membrane protein YedE/YeeE n=1 Tax=Amycolatopsis lexingtonensis TaxID=218822 RepID=A0ABR9ICK2_9PSEU|nr:hypothetical protein [Amycolatopsis lexingtonensis]MBE1500903.1 putative membrane protein YedE/YeeE [Amycolatopsis lexingtonensis]
MRSEPSRAEFVRAAVWLGRHGVRVGVPTPLLATRLGGRTGGNALPLLIRLAVFLLLAAAAAVGYQCLQYLPGVRGVEMTESKVLYFLLAGNQLAFWSMIRAGDRRAARRLGARRLDRPRPSWREVPGGWFLASTAVTFAGGAALAITMFLATPYRTYAWSWLGVLALGGVVFGVIATGIVRRPVLAEDEPSAAVDAVVRIEDLYLVMPAYYALPVLFDLLTTNRQPPGFGPWLIGYAGLALALQLVGSLRHRRRRPVLPPGDYGVPLPAQPGVAR